MDVLSQYSPQYEVFNFPTSATPVITNPNTSNAFWKAVDEYIENNKSQNTILKSSPMPRSTDIGSYELNDNTTKRLDKYNLEIRPKEVLESSAPLLMPPLDTLP